METSFHLLLPMLSCPPGYGADAAPSLPGAASGFNRAGKLLWNGAADAASDAIAAALAGTSPAAGGSAVAARRAAREPGRITVDGPRRCFGRGANR
ncbi:hypothetical protein B7760_04992 [Burkholderia glumae]|nr:hypothetical protein B7760_04992 [Burkholderia glumae]